MKNKKKKVIMFISILIGLFLVIILINNLLVFAFSVENYRYNVNCLPNDLQKDMGIGTRYVNTLYMGESSVIFPENQKR